MVTETECRSWGSFRQIALVQPHETPVGIIKKVVLVSIALPPGTESMGRYLMPGRMDVTSFNNESNLLSAITETGRNRIDLGDLDLFSDFYESTEQVIRNLHYDQSAVQVQEYYSYQKSRKVYLAALQWKAATLLANPLFCHTSAWDSNFGGAFLQEWIFRDGVLIGTDSRGQEMHVDGSLAKGGFGHKEWLIWLTEGVARVNGVAVIEHFDGTASVSECGNKPGCSAFFREMMPTSNFLQVVSDFRSSPIGLWFGEKRLCNSCQKEKKSSDYSIKCKCQENE